jgi:hypothetical protein
MSLSRNFCLKIRAHYLPMAAIRPSFSSYFRNNATLGYRLFSNLHLMFISLLKLRSSEKGVYFDESVHFSNGTNDSEETMTAARQRRQTPLSQRWLATAAAAAAPVTKIVLQ